MVYYLICRRFLFGPLFLLVHWLYNSSLALCSSLSMPGVCFVVFADQAEAQKAIRALGNSKVSAMSPNRGTKSSCKTDMVG